MISWHFILFSVLKEVSYQLGIVLDDYTANFFMEDLKRYGLHDLTLHHRATLQGMSFGMVAMNPEDKIMLQSFFKNNDDNRELMAQNVLRDHDVCMAC